jgi:hypothetical protein
MLRVKSLSQRGTFGTNVSQTHTSARMYFGTKQLGAKIHSRTCMPFGSRTRAVGSVGRRFIH